MLNRAYSLLEIKSVDEEQRVIEGVASTPSRDRQGDIVDPFGGVFELPLPFLWQHGKGQPAIGHVVSAVPQADGIRVRVQMERDDQPGLLKDLLDLAWRSIKKKLVRGLSIGFRPLEGEPIKGTFGMRFKSWEWLELSAVTIAANADASILTTKSLEAIDRAASGDGQALKQVGTLGVTSAVVRLATKDATTTMAKTIAERKLAFSAEKAAKVSKLTELMGEDDGTTLDEQKQQEFDTLDAEIKAIDQHLSRLETLEKVQIANAVEVKGTTVEQGSQSRSTTTAVVQSREQLPKGIGFARSVKARFVARTDGRNVLDVAKGMYPSDDRLHAHLAFQENLPNVMSQIKAAVPAATTTNTTWASALVDPTNLANEFIEFLRPETIIGKLNLRNIPFNVRIIEQTQGGTGYWVGQGAPKPLTAFGFAPITLAYTKVAAIAVATQESLRFSSPDLDNIIRMSLRDALVERIDRDLLDPAEAGTANVQPASLTNGLVPLSSAGTSADNIRTDLGRLIQAFRSANLRGRIVLVMPESLAVTASLMANSLGQSEFPDLTADGGSIRGIRVITSNYMANASGAGNMVVAIAENEVFLADDGSVSVNVSTEASLQMLDNPTNNSATATPTTMVSMFQTNSVAFLAERFINWAKRRDDAVVYMDDVNWGSAGSPS